MAPWSIGVRRVKTALQVVDWHHAEATAAERNRVVVVNTAPGAFHRHVCLTVAHRLVGQTLQVRIGILFAFPPFVVSFWMLWVVGAPVAFTSGTCVRVVLVTVGGAPCCTTLVEHCLSLVPCALIYSWGKSVVAVGGAVDGRWGVEINVLKVGGLLTGTVSRCVPFARKHVFQRGSEQVPLILLQ